MPNYTGQFLRGSGGKAGAIGQSQGSAVYVGANEGINVALQGINTGHIPTVLKAPSESCGDSSCYYNKGEYGFLPFKEDGYTFTYLETGNPYANYYYPGYRSGDVLRGGNVLGISSSGKSYNVPLSISSPDVSKQETRPANVAVKYYIKAKD